MKSLSKLALLALTFSSPTLAETIDCIYNSPDQLRVVLENTSGPHYTMNIFIGGNLELVSKGKWIAGPTMDDTTVYFQSVKNTKERYANGKPIPQWDFTLYSKSISELEINSPALLNQLTMNPHGRNLRCKIK